MNASNIPQSKNVLQMEFLLVEIEGMELVLLTSSTILVYAESSFWRERRVDTTNE
jgi:hypothetical protein